MKKYLHWLNVNSRGVRGAMALNVILGLITVACSLAFIYFCKELVDGATHGTPFRDLIPGAVGVCVLQILRILVGAFNTRYESITNARLGFNIRHKLFANLLQSKWTGKEKLHSGDALNRLFTDVDTVTRVVSDDIPALVVTVIRLAAALAFMALLDVRLAVLLFVVSAVLTGAGKFFFSKLRKLTRDIREKESQVQSHIQESIQNKTLLLSLEMEKILNQNPQNERVKSEKVLEINPGHRIFTVMQSLYDTNKEKFKDYAALLYDQALLIEGMPIEDPLAFSEKICKLMAE